MENSNTGNEITSPNNANTARGQDHVQNIDAQESYSQKIVDPALNTGAESKDVDDKLSEGNLPERLQAVNIPGGKKSF